MARFICPSSEFEFRNVLREEIKSLFERRLSRGLYISYSCCNSDVDTVTKLTQGLGVNCSVVAAKQIPNFHEFNEYYCDKKCADGVRTSRARSLLDYLNVNGAAQALIIEDVDNVLQRSAAHLMSGLLLSNRFGEDPALFKTIPPIILLEDCPSNGEADNQFRVRFVSECDLTVIMEPEDK